MDIKIATRLAETRKKHGMSQGDLAEKIGVSRQAVSKWERGESSPDIDKIFALADIYCISTDELLGYTAKTPVSDAEEAPAVEAAPAVEEISAEETPAAEEATVEEVPAVEEVTPEVKTEVKSEPAEEEKKEPEAYKEAPKKRGLFGFFRR